LAPEQHLYIVNRLFGSFEQELKQVFLPLGPAAGVGASYCCREIAAAAATLLPMLSVVLVDMNIHHPSLSESVGNPIKGWAPWLVKPEQYPLREAIKPWQADEHLNFLPMGHVVDCREATAQMSQWPTVIKALRQQYDLVLVDVPAFYQGAEARVLCQAVDEVLLVIEADGSRKPSIRQMVDELRGLEASIMGVVFNKRRLRIPRWIYRRLFS
jgi:Mrp family chromosome partitioning ATPase